MLPFPFAGNFEDIKNRSLQCSRQSLASCGGEVFLQVTDREHAQRLTRESAVLRFNQEAAEIAAYIFPRLSQKERNRLWTDVFIAATALAHDYGIATRNRSDFELIAQYIPSNHPPLRIEVWKR